MNDECLVAVYKNAEEVEQAVHILKRGGFPIAQISVVSKGVHNPAEQLGELEMGGDDSVHDAAIGSGLGGIVGVFAGAEMFVVFGLGTVFFFGPIFAIMGAVVGGFLGAISGWGVHSEKIHHYEELVRQGKILVIAHGNPLEVIEAERILKETDPIEISLYAKTSSEAPEVNIDEKLDSAKV